MAASKMFSISLSVDATMELINTTHTCYEDIEECLNENNMVGLFEIDPQNMKIYVSKSIDSAHVFVKSEALVRTVTSNFSVTRGKPLKIHLY